MLTFILKRILLSIPTLLILVVISFVLIHFSPGTPFTGDRTLPPQILQNILHQYHLDKPLWKQFFYYVNQLLHGDLGPSFRYQDFTVNQLLVQSLPVSIEIGFLAFTLAVVFGILIGTITALKQNTWIDYLLMSVSMAGIVLPSFVIAPLLVLIFAVWLKWLPAGGWHATNWHYVILPVLAMAFLYITVIARIMRGSLLEILNSPFIRTAKAKGLPGWYIILAHALKPALLPVISYLGPTLVGIITGSVVIETVFALPGVGQLFVQGALNRDYSLILGLTLMIGVLTIIFTIIVDIIYAFIDPRVRYE